MRLPHAMQTWPPRRRLPWKHQSRHQLPHLHLGPLLPGPCRCARPALQGPSVPFATTALQNRVGNFYRLAEELQQISRCMCDWLAM